MNNPITNFIKASQSQAFKEDRDKFYDYPIQVNALSNIHTMYIQDVDIDIKEGVHTLTVICLYKADGEDRVVHIIKRCTLPTTCIRMDWDNVVCATALSWQSKITDEI